MQYGICGAICRPAAERPRVHDSTHEHLLAALLALTHSHPPSIEECRRSEFLFREFLDNRLELIGDRDECLVIFYNRH
jgi:hypothetical protein